MQDDTITVVLPLRLFVVDIGGEGRNLGAYNVNPRRFKTLGPDQGQPIPRLIVGRGESLPLPDECADTVIVERTPISRRALVEIRRIAKPGALVVLRHARALGRDPHLLAKQLLHGEHHESECNIGPHSYHETIINLDKTDDTFTEEITNVATNAILVMQSSTQPQGQD